QHARADVGQAGQFEQSLDGSILAEGAVQYGKDDIDAGIGAGLGGNRPRIPMTVGTDKDALDFVLPAIQARDDRFGRAQRDLVLAATSSVKNCDTHSKESSSPKPTSVVRRRESP